VDAYIAADPAIEQRLIELGVNENKLTQANLPVERLKEKKPDALFKEQMPTLVLFGNYLEKMEHPGKFYEWLNESGWQTIVVNGGRRNLSRSLGHVYSNIHELLEVDSIQEVLLHADLLVAKPLYITAYEALLNRTPMVAYTTKEKPMLDIVEKTAMFASNMDELRSILMTFIASEEMRKECHVRIERAIEDYEQDRTYVQVARELLAQVENNKSAN
jgi:hypothetical protein